MNQNEDALRVEQITYYFNHFCEVFLPTLCQRKFSLTSLGILAQSPINVLSQGHNNDGNEQKGMCYRLISPFFDFESIHLHTLSEFSLYLPNAPPYEDMLSLIAYIIESEHKLIKFRLELPTDQRFKKKTRKLLEVLAKFVDSTPDLIELHLHITSTVNSIGIKKLFESVRNHPNLLVFEMGEMRMNQCTWNAMIDIFYCSGDAMLRSNSNLQLFKVHFCYKPWHKILDNPKLNMTHNDPLRIIEAMYKNQEYLYRQIRAFEQCMKEQWNVSSDTVSIMKSFVFNQSVFTLKLAGLSHEIKKKNLQCFNWFHQLMFNDVPIENKSCNEEKVKVIETQEQLLHVLDWNVLRSHVVKRQLVFR